MREYRPNKTEFSEKINIIEKTDPTYFEVVNQAPKQLIENDLYLYNQMQKKANITDISSPYQFRGACLSTNLPGSGNKINDTYYVTDKKCKFTWNGAAWYQSSLNESDYEESLNSLNENLATLIEDNPEYLRAVVDSEGRFLWGIRMDGEVVYGPGVPAQIKVELENLSKELSEKIINLGKNIGEKLDASVRELGYAEENPEFLRVITDSDGKVLWGIKSDGNVAYGAGVPEQIKSEIKKVVDDSTKGINQFGLYLDENGNICQEVQE